MISCDCSTDDFEPCRVYVERVRKAKKEHKCYECGEAIKIGTKYTEGSGIDGNGSAFRHRVCTPCMRIIEHYCPSGHVFGGLREILLECIGFDYVTGPDPDEEDNPWFDGNVPVTPVGAK